MHPGGPLLRSSPQKPPLLLHIIQDLPEGKAHPEAQVNIQDLISPSTLLPSSTRLCRCLGAHISLWQRKMLLLPLHVGDEGHLTKTSAAAARKDRATLYSEVSSFLHLYACCITYSTLTSGPKFLLCKLIVTIKFSLSINKLWKILLNMSL